MITCNCVIVVHCYRKHHRREEVPGDVERGGSGEGGTKGRADGLEEDEPGEPSVFVLNESEDGSSGPPALGGDAGAVLPQPPSNPFDRATAPPYSPPPMAGMGERTIRAIFKKWSK